MILLAASENHVGSVSWTIRIYPRGEGPEVVAVNSYRIDSPRNLCGIV